MKFEKFANQFLADAKKKIPNSRNQEQITQAGADVLKKQIHNAAMQHHHSNNSEAIHLADDIHVVSGDIAGEHNGASTVGFAKKGHIARFLNDGTKYIKGDHWFDVAVEKAKPDVIAAMEKKFKEVTRNDAG